MIAATSKLFTSISPARITGPIFEKELRVSSRRKRTYFLRLLFIIAITTFMAIVWMNEVDRHLFKSFKGSIPVGNLSSLEVQAQMAQIGKLIITSVSWFLSYTMPSLAIILLSTSISSEIQAKTIGVLVSTPISSFQIVMGKMLSKLYQLILLMAISLPILAMLRVFGGVQMDYIIATFCTTLTLTLLAGSLSLFLSIYVKKAFIVIPVVAGFMFISCYINYLLLDEFSHIEVVEFLLMSLNSFVVMDEIEYIKLSSIDGDFLIWATNCFVMLMASGYILFVASLKVRKVALMQVTGQLSPLKRWLNTESKKEHPKTVNPVKPKKIRSVSDNPVIWREARSVVFVKRKFLRIASMAVVILGSTVLFFQCLLAAVLDRGRSLPASITGFMLYGTIFTVIFPAMCIPAEKESRSWPMLMSTSLTGWQILKGKFVGILRKCLFPWALLLMFMVYVLIARLNHPITILFILLNIISVITVLSGAGLFFGTLFRKANSAVIANIIFAVCIWIILPMLSDFRLFILGDIFDFFLSMNPFRQAAIVVNMSNFSTDFSHLVYRWDSGRLGAFATLMTITISTLLHLSLGAFLAVLAKKRLRKNIF